jgi:aryl-alcohol dehydrogenase-like predicted oxidoreductase
MQTRKLGNGGLEVSALGLGCMGISHAYGLPTEKREAIKLLRKAVDIGYTFFDTAEVYGPHENEEMVGEALKPFRNQVIIATKFGVHLENGSTGAPIPNAQPATIRQSVEGSLRRLQIDTIDLYYQHRIDPKIPAEEVAAVMADLIREGKIRHWGVSETDEKYLRRAHSVCPLAAVENRYSMMARNYEELFPIFEELGIGFVAFSPMANGFLSGKYDKNSKFEAGLDYRSRMPQFTAEGIDKNQELLALLNATAERKNATPAQISLAWMICKKPWIVPIPGTRKVERLGENAGAADMALTAQEVKALDDALDALPMSEVFGGSEPSGKSK